MSGSRRFEVRRLGLVPYADGLELQRALVEDRKADRIPDTLLLLQHPHVVTIGVKKDGRAHIIATPEQLSSRGVEVFETGRGGDVTYHGPGQLVGYPILDLESRSPGRASLRPRSRRGDDPRVRRLRHLPPDRVKGFSGAWIGDAKIGAIGVRISRWITSHGFAFNVTTDVDFFNLIVPCGIADRGVTSLAAQLGRAPEMTEVEDRFDRFDCAQFAIRAANVDSQAPSVMMRRGNVGSALCCPHFHTPSFVRATMRSHGAVGRSRAAFYSRFLVIGPRSPRSMSFASVGWRHLRDDHRCDQDTNRAPPTVSWLRHRCDDGSLRRRRSLFRVKRRAIAPDRIQNATQAPRQRDHRDASAASRRELLRPRA